MADFSFLYKYLWDWVINPLFWVLIILFILGMAAISLYVRKRRKLQFPSLEVTEFGYNNLKTGWFGKDTYIFGLWDYGSEVLKTKAGEVIEQFSEEDFTEINGKRGVIFFREPVNRHLLPIRFKLDQKSRELIGSIPPRDFVNTAIAIIDDASKETSDWKNKVMMALLIGGIIIFSLVSIIMVVKFTDNRLDKASEFVTTSGKTCADQCKLIWGELASQFSKASGAP
jgi:hypothetical protein